MVGWPLVRRSDRPVYVGAPGPVYGGIVSANQADAEVGVVIDAGDAERGEVNGDLVDEAAAIGSHLDGADVGPTIGIPDVGVVLRLQVAEALRGYVPIVLEDDVVLAGGRHVELGALGVLGSGGIPAVAYTAGGSAAALPTYCKRGRGCARSWR